MIFSAKIMTSMSIGFMVLTLWFNCAAVESLAKNSPQVKQVSLTPLPIPNEPKLQDLPNFQMVEAGIWRGGQPSSEALSVLADSGVRTIVDLRLNGRAVTVEEKQVRALGLKYVHIPLGYSKPTKAQIDSFMKVVKNPQNQPVYVHCRQGADRTGALIGIYRLEEGGWTFKQAYGEMRAHHFKPWMLPLKQSVASSKKPFGVSIAAKDQTSASN
jgi:protein tyrosine phosphatase (PTP) superfamily phosphohydrolase (DUF442 family)